MDVETYSPSKALEDTLQDAELLQLLAEVDAESKAIDVYFDRNIYGSPEVEALIESMNRKFRLAMLIPARTPEGVKAKARQMDALVERDCNDEVTVGDWMNLVAYSLARDILRPIA